MINIPTTVDRYGELLSSPDIRLLGLKTYARSITISVVPEGKEGRQTFGGPLVPGPWAFANVHATVIDNNGGSARTAREAPLALMIGEPFTVDGLPGTWTLRKPDSRRAEGDSPVLVPSTPVDLAPCETELYALYANGNAIATGPLYWCEEERDRIVCGSSQGYGLDNPVMGTTTIRNPRS